MTPALGFGTDCVGTFAGEVPRRGGARETAREKALTGMPATRTALAVASEGAFAPHPYAPLLPIGVDLLLLVDRRDGLEIADEDVTTATNHARVPCRDLAEAQAFGGRIGIPDHGLVLTLGEQPRRVHRGLHGLPALAAAVADLQRAAAAEGLP